MSQKFVRIGAVYAVGVAAALTCSALLPAGMWAVWHGGLSVVIGWAIAVVLAWRLRIRSADIWWWPLAAPKDADDER